MLKYKYAIFDWNGTLIDDTFANHAGANAELRALGVPEVTIERYRETMDFPLIHFFNRNGVDADTFLKKADKMKGVFMDVYDPLQKTAPLRRGAMELLDALLDRDVTLIILSNHIQEHLEQQMAARHVHGKFKHICGNPKFDMAEITGLNKLQRLEKLMAENGYNPHDAFIIGDSLEEPDIAQKLEMTCISVTWGCFAESRLKETTTDHIVNELSDVLPFLLKKSV